MDLKEQRAKEYNENRETKHSMISGLRLMWVVIFRPVSRGYGQCTWAIFGICNEQIK
jgi:hypothetical protein